MCFSFSSIFRIVNAICNFAQFDVFLKGVNIFCTLVIFLYFCGLKDETTYFVKLKIIKTMKRIFITLCLFMACLSINAHKSYVYIIFNHFNSSIYRCGGIPTDIYESIKDSSFSIILNTLSEIGYEVEFISPVNESSKVLYLLSKKTDSGYNNVPSVQSDNDNVTEIARYNLQGMPVKESEKGIQIIVYSNYTTKTVIVQ